MRSYHNQLGRVESIDDHTHDVIQITIDTPIVQLQVNEAEYNIEELQEKNRLLNKIIIKLQTEISTRLTLAVVNIQQEVGRLLWQCCQDQKTYLNWKKQSLKISMHSTHNLSII